MRFRSRSSILSFLLEHLHILVKSVVSPPSGAWSAVVGCCVFKFRCCYIRITEYRRIVYIYHSCNVQHTMPRIVLCGHWDYNPDCFERADKQAPINETLSLLSFKTDEQVLIHRPYNEADGPNPKLISPWRGPYTVRAQMSPVIYRVTKRWQPGHNYCPTWQDEKIRCPSVVPRPRP